MGLRDRFIRPRITFRDAALEELLREVNFRGTFSACLLATGDGLPITAVPPDMDAETASAMVALVQESVQRAQKGLDFPGVDEVSALFRNGVRLVCRYFDVAESPFILAVILPNGREYRAIMDDAVTRIAQLLAAVPSQPQLASVAA